MEAILEKLRKAGNESLLMQVCNRPEKINRIFELVVSSNKHSIRQYSIMLLTKHFDQIENWQLVPRQQQEVIKNGIVNVMAKETQKPICIAITRLVAVLGKHETENKRPWMNEVLQWVYGQCHSVDSKHSECGSAIFATLADVTPHQVVGHFDGACEMFATALMTMEASGNLVSPILFNIIEGMTNLVPFVSGHTKAEQTYQMAIPTITKTIYAYALQSNLAKFLKTFDLLQNVAKYTPKLLTTETQFLVNFCLETAGNSQFLSSMRVKALTYMDCLMCQKKKIIIKLGLVKPIVEVIFKIIASQICDGEDDDTTNTMTVAIQMLDLLAFHIPPEILLSPLLNLFDAAIYDQKPFIRRAVYLCIAVVAEGCSDAIGENYAESLIYIIVKIGIDDPNSLVRSAAFYALGQFSAHIQPHISKYAAEILPIFFKLLMKLNVELRNGHSEPKYIECLFYALEILCENLQYKLVSYLPLLMGTLFELLDPSNSVHLRELTLSTVSAAVHASKKYMVPFFDRLIAVLQLYCSDSSNDDIICLRIQAIDTLAAIARNIGKKTFMPVTMDAMNYALKSLEVADEPRICRSLYNLIAALAKITTKKMASVYPMIMERIYKSILRTTEVPRLPNRNDEDDEDQGIDLKYTNSEDSGVNKEIEYLDEKEEAILTLQEFARYTGTSFKPYLETSFENVFQMIEHPHCDIRIVSIKTLAIFVVAIYRNDDLLNLTISIDILLSKISQIIHEDKEMSVVLSALHNCALLLTELKENALPNSETNEMLFNCISDIMLGKVACQFNDTSACDDDFYESEFDEKLFESAGNLLPLFGQALSCSKEFSLYFDRIYPIIVQQFQKAKKIKNAWNQRAWAYGVLAECFPVLNMCTGAYFNILCPLMIDGLNDESDLVRRNSVFGLGELIFYAGEKSFDSYPHILNVLSQATSKETIPVVLDNICGAISRLVITNYNLVPLSEILPHLLKNLPLREDHEENLTVFKCFRLLYSEIHDRIKEYIRQICKKAFNVIQRKQIMDWDTIIVVQVLLQEIYEKDPRIYYAVAKSNTDVALF